MEREGRVGVSRNRAASRQMNFTWPIRADICGYCPFLLSWNTLQEPISNVGISRVMGIEQIYRAQRVHIGQGANFKVSFRQARTVWQSRGKAREHGHGEGLHST